MPKNLRADIEWHKVRIAFYTQALEDLAADQNVPDADACRTRMAELKIVVANLQRTLDELEKLLAERG